MRRLQKQKRKPGRKHTKPDLAPPANFAIEGDLTLADLRDILHLIRAEFYKEIDDKTFAVLLNVNEYPLPYYSIGHVESLCRRTGLKAKIVIEKQKEGLEI